MNAYFLHVITGLFIGGGVFLIGMCMDVTISKGEYDKFVSTENGANEYTVARKSCVVNLLVLTPLMYPLALQTIIVTNNKCFNVLSCIIFTCVHNCLYFLVHRLMHTNRHMYKYHKFHHRFDNNLIASIGNAISPEEFVTAHIVPVFISGYIVRPNEASFIVTNYILLIFNMCLHCEQLTHIRWLPGLVTPLQHHQHHKNRTKHYSGPIIDYDWLITQT